MRNRQTRLESFLEVITNIAFGFVLSYLTWIFVIPAFYPEAKMSWLDGLGVTSIFTVVSVTRSYVWRRLFERETHLKVHAFLTKPRSGFLDRLTDWENY